VEPFGDFGFAIAGDRNFGLVIQNENHIATAARSANDCAASHPKRAVWLNADLGPKLRRKIAQIGALQVDTIMPMNFEIVFNRFSKPKACCW